MASSGKTTVNAASVRVPHGGIFIDQGFCLPDSYVTDPVGPCMGGALAVGNNLFPGANPISSAPFYGFSAIFGPGTVSPFSDGKFKVSAQLCGLSAIPAQLAMAIYHNGVYQNGLSSISYFSNIQICQVVINGIIALSGGDTVDARITYTAAPGVVNVNSFYLNLHRIEA